MNHWKKRRLRRTLAISLLDSNICPYCKVKMEKVGKETYACPRCGLRKTNTKWDRT